MRYSHTLTHLQSTVTYEYYCSVDTIAAISGRLMALFSMVA